MLIELIVTAIVVAYLAIVVLGHVLLIAAICKCLREDYMGGRGRKTSWHPKVIDGTKAASHDACVGWIGAADRRRPLPCCSSRA